MRQSSQTFPPIGFGIVSDALVHCRSSAILDRSGRAYYPMMPGTRLDRQMLRNGHLETNGHRYATFNVAGAMRVPKGIFLGGNGSFNWYHWLIEILPKALLLDLLPVSCRSSPLLVPPEVGSVPTFRESLEAVAPGRETIELDPARPYWVSDLAVIDTPSICFYNGRKGSWPQLDEAGQHAPLLMMLRERLRKYASLPEVGSRTRRILLARRGDRRPSNSLALEQIFKPLGFESVYLERMSLSEQIRLFDAAECVAGPSGAAWAHMLIARSGTRALSWMPEQLKDGSFFSSLAALSGVDLRYVLYPCHARSTGEVSGGAPHEPPADLIAAAANEYFGVRP